jgi:SAM-dependent methyltransferase
MKKNRYKHGDTNENNLSQLWTYEYLIKFCKINKSHKVLDVGCADGILGRFLNKSYLVGVDINQPREELNGYNNFIVSDIEGNAEEIKEHFDFSVSVSVFQYLLNFDEAFENLLRLSNKVVLLIPNKDRIFLKDDETQKTNLKEMKRLASKYNLGLRYKFISNRFNLIRRIHPRLLSGGIIAEFCRK